MWYMCGMDANDRLVAVPERLLLDWEDLTLRALDQLEAIDSNGALGSALRGAVMDLRIRARTLVS